MIATGTPKLSISMVHHDGIGNLRNCLDSLRMNPPSATWEVVLVDNVSTDGSRELVRTQYPEVILLENSERHGFGANQNTGMRVCRGEYILLLNDDTLMHEGACDELVRFLDSHPETDVVGPRLLHADGSLQRNCFRFPTPLRCLFESFLLTAALPNHPFFGDYRAWAHASVREVDFISGAVLLVRRRLLDRVGEFDTGFYMYAEETDWQKRIRAAGGKVMFCPTAVVTHLGGGSSAGMRDRQFCEFQRSQKKYMRKHHGVVGVGVQRAAVLFGALIRLPIWACIYPFRPSVARRNIFTWGRMLRWWLGFGPHEGINNGSSRATSAASGASIG